jgi:hypothetical protein
LQKQQAEVFGVRPVETFPPAVEVEPSTEDAPELIIPPPAPISEVL